jgi:arylsulfatase A-like enzyme
MRLFKRLIPAILLVLCVCAHAAARPNLIVVLIDDMGYGDLSCYGNNQVQTKNIDRLASEGIRFTQFYAGAPICSPSRTALLTGQFPARWQITSYLASRKENERRGVANWLDPRAPSLARMLRVAGYRTGHFGKWHMGGQRDVGDAPLITEYGFDESLTQFEGLGDRVLPLCDAYDGKPARKYALGSDLLGRGTITWEDRSKVTGAFVKRALEFIKAAERAQKPFYLNLWPDDVHSPFFPPKALRGDGTKRELYLGVVKAMDEQLGVLFDYIRDQPALRTNTLIMVSSDNGPEPGAGDAGPFRGHKGNLYEGGVREPLVVWGPGLVADKARGSVNEKTVIAAVDLLPSLAHLAQGQLPAGVASDGEDLSASLVGQLQQTRTKRLMWSRPPDRPGTEGEKWPDLSIRDADWKLLVMNDGKSPQLYDLAKDRGERTNVAANQPEVVERLTAAVLSWRKSLPVAALTAPSTNSARAFPSPISKGTAP